MNVPAGCSSSIVHQFHFQRSSDHPLSTIHCPPIQLQHLCSSLPDVHHPLSTSPTSSIMLLTLPCVHRPLSTRPVSAGRSSLPNVRHPWSTSPAFGYDLLTLSCVRHPLSTMSKRTFHLWFNIPVAHPPTVHRLQSTVVGP